MEYISGFKIRMVADNVENIRRRIASACSKVGRTAEEVTLVAVTKTFDSSRIREAVDAGVLDIGENFVQELSRKRNQLRDERIRWHFVGHLQTNKVRHIAEWIYLIHSVDSVHVGKELSKRGEQLGRTIEVLVEVNTSAEPTKFGVEPEKTASLVQELSTLRYIRVQGLMTIGPFLPDPELSRPAFRLLRELREKIRQTGLAMPHLSMGMTNDFEVAIEEGATILRIGTALFGRRVKNA